MTSLFSAHDFEMNFSHLDDKMEVGTSPYPQVDDIDFDFEPDRQHSVDRSMADDAETVNNTEISQADLDITYNDDDMLDDETIEQPFDNNINDLSMEQDDEEPTIQQDDEIVYDDDEEVEEVDSVDMTEHQEDAEIVEDSIPQSVNNEETLSIEEDLDNKNEEEIHNHSNTNKPVEASNALQQSNNENAIDDEEQNDKQAHEDDTVEVVDFAGEDVRPVQSTNDTAKATSPDGSPSRLDPQEKQPEETPQEIRSERLLQTFAESSTAQEESIIQSSESQAPETNEDVEARPVVQKLHPITVLYLGQEMSFFPPMMEDSSATFFLSDSKLAYEPVEKLLASCRDILGDTLEHDDELVLDVPSLGLHICEDSKYASQITLSQVADVYVSLSRNENVEDVEPLYCSLSSRVCLSSQYAYLASCAVEGKTYSEIAADYIDSPEHEATSFPEDHEPESLNTVKQPDILSHHDNAVVDAADPQDDHVKTSEDTDELAPELPETLVETNSEAAGTAVVTDSAEDPTTFQTTNPETDASLIEDQTSSENRAPEASKILPLDQIENPEAEQPGAEDENATYDATNEPAEHEDNASGSSHTVEADDVTSFSKKSPSGSNEHALDNLDTDDNDDNEEDTRDDVDTYNLNDGVLEEFDSESYRVDTQTTLNGDSKDEGLVGQSSSHNVGDVSAESNDVIDDAFNFEGEEEDMNSAAISTETEVEEEVDLLQVEDMFAASAPITPSKQNGSKRKALNDEDDLDFLDFSTPEPKRTRAL